MLKRKRKVKKKMMMMKMMTLLIILKNSYRNMIRVMQIPHICSKTIPKS